MAYGLSTLSPIELTVFKPLASCIPKSGENLKINETTSSPPPFAVSPVDCVGTPSLLPLLPKRFIPNFNLSVTCASIFDKKDALSNSEFIITPSCLK